MGRCIRNYLFPSWLKFSRSLIGQQETVLIGKEKSWSYGVAANAHLRHVHGIPLGEVVYGSFRRRVCWNFRQRADGVHRGNIQHIPLPCLKHILGKDHCGQQRPFEIQVEYEIETCHIQPIEGICQIIIFGHLFYLAGCLRRVSTCAVYQNVNFPKFCVNILQGCLQFYLVQGAGRDAQAFDAELLGYGLTFFRVIFRAADDGKIHPCLRQTASECSPDDAETSSDDAVASFQIVK